MAHPRTQSMLPGWSPLAEPTRRSGAELGRWLWPGLVFAAFAALVAYVFATSPGLGISTRGLVTLPLAVIVLAVLTLRRRWGPLAVLRTLAEYAVVAALAGLLVVAAGPSLAPVERPARDRRQATEQSSTLPPVVRQVVGAVGWVAELWHQAGRDNRQPESPPTTRGERSDAASRPHWTGGPSW